MHWSELNSDLKHRLKHIFGEGGGILSKLKLTNKAIINENFEIWSKTSNQI